MTAKEFVIRIEKFYEPFTKPEIKLEFFNVIHKFSESQIDLIFDMYIQHIKKRPYYPQKETSLSCLPQRNNEQFSHL